MENHVDERDIVTGLLDGCKRPGTCFTMFDQETGPYPEAVGKPGPAKPDQGPLAALVIADSFANYYRAENCDLDVIGTPVKSVNQALAFVPEADSGISNAVIQHFNIQLLRMQAGGTLQKLQDHYLGSIRREKNCAHRISTAHGLRYQHLHGLFVFVAVGIIVASTWELLHWVRKAPRYWSVLREGKRG